MKFDKRGREKPDRTPVEIPAGLSKPEPLHVRMQRMIRGSLSEHASARGAETFEEANDFEVEEDQSAELFPTHHELHEELVDEIREKKARDAARSVRSEAVDEDPEDDVREVRESSTKKRAVPRRKSHRVRDVVEEVDDSHLE